MYTSIFGEELAPNRSNIRLFGESLERGLIIIKSFSHTSISIAQPTYADHDTRPTKREPEARPQHHHCRQAFACRGVVEDVLAIPIYVAVVVALPTGLNYNYSKTQPHKINSA